MENQIRSFRDLRVWQKGIELVKEVYKISKSFPKDEQYGITAQIRRSSISIPSNIAEGHRRRYIREYKQFINIALGSCGELETQIVIARELNYIDKIKEGLLMGLIDNICRMLVSLAKKL